MLADDDGIFGSSMSDSTRAMVTENAEDILVVIYCFENNIERQNAIDNDNYGVNLPNDVLPNVDNGV